MSSNLEQILKTGKDIFSIIISPEIQERLWPLKILFTFFFLGFLFIVVYLAIKTSFFNWWKLSWLKSFVSKKAIEAPKKLAKVWAKTKKNSQNESETQRKLALLKAYELVNDILDRLGHPGTNIEEKLADIPDFDGSLKEKLLASAKTCQDILRDPNYFLDKGKVKEVLDNFEQFLVEIEILEK